MSAIVNGVLHTSTRAQFDKVLADAGFKVVELPEKSNLIPWQKVFQDLHTHASKCLDPGQRYEIRLSAREGGQIGYGERGGKSVTLFRFVEIVANDSLNRIEPWTDTPEQTADHYRVGRYVTPKE